MAGELVALGKEELTEQQAKFVELIVAGEQPSVAKIQAGYSDKTPTVSILRGQLVQNAIRLGVEAELNGPMRVLAMRKLHKLLTDEKTPAATALNAAKLVIERGDDAASKQDEKPLTMMNEDELTSLIHRLEEARQAGLVNVTPQTGA